MTTALINPLVPTVNGCDRIVNSPTALRQKLV